MSENNNYPKEKGLSIGTKAPEFSTTDVDGKKIVLKDILQNYNGLLIDFFRGAWWHTCEEHSKLLNQHLDDFKKHNIKLISMSTDSKNHLQQYQEDNNLRFPQISDRGARVAREFDVDVFDKGAGKEIKFKQAIPSKFLIDKSSIIIWNYIAKTKTERPDIKIIIKEIEKRV